MIKIFFHFFMFMVITCLFYVLPAQAEVLSKLDTNENRRILKDVEKAYNKIKTLKAKFAQYNSKMTDDLQTGVLYLSRPGNLRLVYEQGSPLEFYVHDGYLIYHDKSLKEVSYFDVEQTPVSLILKEKLLFSDPDFLVIDITTILDEYHVTAQKKGAPELGSITLIIDRDSLQLKQWDVTDMQEVTSTVSLFDIEQNIPVDKKMFLFQNPYKDLKK